LYVEADDPEHADMREGNYVVLSVEDSGTVTLEAAQDRMFEPFYTTARQSAGDESCLGLATIWDCVQEMDGTVQVCSLEPVGTVVKVYLPADNSPTLSDQPGTNGDGRGYETILLADDEEVIRKVTAHLLRGLGYTVHCAADGEEALTFLEREENSVDLVVLDVDMPRMDGKEALRRTRAMGLRLPVIMATSHSALVEGDDVFELGASGHVQKPFTIRSLTTAIRQVLDSSNGSNGTGRRLGIR